jgi:hypothetical protein
MTETKATGRITVKALRNFAPPKGANIPAEKIDPLGRVRKGTIVELPRSIASDFLRARIVSADAAFTDS